MASIKRTGFKNNFVEESAVQPKVRFPTNVTANAHLELNRNLL